MWEVVLSGQKLNFCSIYIQYSSDVILRILSMPTEVFCIYSVWNWRHPAYTQCSSGGKQWLGSFCYVLSIPRKSPISHWVYPENLRRHTEYMQNAIWSIMSIRKKAFIFVLSMRIICFLIFSINLEKFIICKKHSFLHWVWAESLKFYTEYIEIPLFYTE